MKITNPDGSVVYEQNDVEAPVSWSDTAVTIVSQKYFRGHLENGTRETSVKQVVSRAADTIAGWAVSDGYLNKEAGEKFKLMLRGAMVDQKFAFNSPVYFNVGTTEKPQCSACFIQAVDDDMDSIMRLACSEVRLFRGGSGSGSNLSKIRAEGELITGSGHASGPLSFMRGYDAFAGAIRSGGKCLAPNQRVLTASGPKTVKELAESGVDFVTLSYDYTTNRFMAKTARAWKAGEKPLVRVVTDKGEFFLSNDHPVKLSTHNYIAAGDLLEGMSLFSCTVDLQNGYARVGLKDGKKGKALLHRLVAKDVMGIDIGEVIIHHKDHSKLNNAPENLGTFSTHTEHTIYHTKELVSRGEHVFQKRKFPKIGKDTPMHVDSAFWKDSERVNSYRSKQGTILKSSGRAVTMQKHAARQKMLNLAFELKNAGCDISTFEGYCLGRKKVRGAFGISKAELLKRINRIFGSYDEFVDYVNSENHTVVCVESLGVSDVYDVEVDCGSPDDKSPTSGHNFVIWSADSFSGSGVVVANTRRAAKLICLDADHPDIEGFISCKANEEQKAWALIDAGYDGNFNVTGGAYDTVGYQNANHSVRVSDEFMRSVVNDGEFTTTYRTTREPAKTYKARHLMKKMAEAAWLCGDPGIQFDDTINRWHTVKDSGRINASNPCCFTGDTLVETSEGRLRIDHIEGMSSKGCNLPHALCYDRENRLPTASPISKAWIAGYTRNLVRVTTSKGIVVTCTPEHKWLMKDGSYRAANDLRRGDRLEKLGFFRNPQRSNRRYINHRETESAPNGTRSVNRWLWESVVGNIPEGHHVHHLNGDPTDDRISNLSLEVSTEHYSYHSRGSSNCRYIKIDPRLAVEVYDFLMSTGVRRFTVERWNRYVKNNSMRGSLPTANTRRGISGMSWAEFTQWVESHLITTNDTVTSVEDVSLEEDVPVYDMEVERYHNFSVSSEGIEHAVVVSNSEYMHLDDSACNLASINLGKFIDSNGEFLWEDFRDMCHLVILAQEVIVSRSSYPTEKIAENSELYRPLGLGFSNLGKVLMCKGLAYDSDEARDFAGRITSMMGASAYEASGWIGRVKGPFEGSKVGNNRVHMREVIRSHRDCASAAEYRTDVWDKALELAYSIRNAQATVLAPTGTISFMMDCDTTGIEPEIALVKYKKLVGGGYLKMVNPSVNAALFNLNYIKEDRDKIIQHIDIKGTIEGSVLKDEHLPIFDCSFKASEGGRAIHYMAHVKMMAACQPYLSGAISKTVNMPNDVTPDDIMQTYIQAWEMGLKSIAIYRDGCKRTQPLSTSVDTLKDKTSSESAPDATGGILEGVSPSERRRLPDTRQSITHKFSVGGHEGYLHVGMYEDGSPGELFIAMSKEGSTLSGLMDAFATSISMLLQHGVSLQKLADKFTGTKFEPAGWTGNSEIPLTTSLIDYVFRYLLLNFSETDTVVEDESKSVPKQESKSKVLTSVSDSGRMCVECGSLMQRAGSCYTCITCGSTTGCG